LPAHLGAHCRRIDSIADRALNRRPGVPHVQSEAHVRDARATLNYESAAKTLTEKADAILIHKVWGLLIFAAIMGALFYSLFFIADPITGWVEEGVAWLGGLVTSHLPEGPVQDLWADGKIGRASGRERGAR